MNQNPLCEVEVQEISLFCRYPLKLLAVEVASRLKWIHLERKEDSYMQPKMA
jgi:hypothetical protein